jgi:L-threonylcarbamoyladenylate synthase
VNRTAELANAVERLRSGQLVCFPTETVYGLGADAANPEAVGRIFALKGRPANHPLIVHLGAIEQLGLWANNVPQAAWALAEAFWPGPLTLILEKAPWVPLAVTGGQQTIGLRIPAHPLALELLRQFGSGLAAPSANRFGRISPTTAAHVLAEFGAETPLILDGGPCRIGVESTIIHLAGKEAVLLRPGQVTPNQLAQVLGAPPRDHQAKDQVRAPGLLASHYAPCTPLRLCPPEALPAACADLAPRRLAVLGSPALDPKTLPTSVRLIPMPETHSAYSQLLYATLRALDAQGYDLILACSPPTGENWQAIHNRLSRAAAPIL